MRLQETQIQAIKESFQEIFHEGTISLFGSRVHDEKRGGDIDLFLEVPNKDELFIKRIQFLARIKRRIGEQRIDVVFAEDPTRPIEQEARKWAIPLYCTTSS
jgi:uncharacterized protein